MLGKPVCGTHWKSAELWSLIYSENVTLGGAQLEC